MLRFSQRVSSSAHSNWAVRAASGVSAPSNTSTSASPPKRKKKKNKQVSQTPASDTSALVEKPFLFETVPHEETSHIQVAKLAHGLDRVLFNPGIHWLKDPRTNVFNFDPFLETVTQPEDFNFNAMPPYRLASADKILLSLTKKHNRKYFSSTSSITGLLAQMYHLISNHKGINEKGFSTPYAKQKNTYTMFQRKPTSALLRIHDSGVYSIDQEKGPQTEKQSNEILMHLGKSLEKLVTADKEEYATFLNGAVLPEGHEFQQEEAFHYAKVEGFMLRSQLDCVDARLPGKTFDIKTRASVVVRMDPEHYKDHQDYKLNRLKGMLSSFEREYFDMARSTMLKYNLQVRIGNMDGIFVAYHNTHSIFGFQYISREEMNAVLYGSCAFGDAAFAMATKALEAVLDKALTRYRGENVRITVKVQKDELIFYVEPVSETVREGEGRLTKYRMKIHFNSYKKFSEQSNEDDVNRQQGDWMVRGNLNGGGNKQDISSKRGEFDASQWNIAYSITEIAHQDAASVTGPNASQTDSTAEAVPAFVNTDESPFSGEADLAAGLDSLYNKRGGNQFQQKPLHVEYADVRKSTGNLNRSDDSRKGAIAFAKQIKREAARLDTK
ncbi:hypothetical protein CcCBS67573_g00863 [Chytriomyces confervae]|uniref:Pet127-domain-containing protein n=1 Tax=Chytriomyces confervae TaxID=246404 RepID=A0A507FN13_9FUNG|nr:hypothetical protein CcCBS67573_g00863 [Chytriomyces confervae]